MQKASSTADIKKLRRRARALGLSIRTRSAPKLQATRSYDLVEIASGSVLFGNLSGLEDIDEILNSVASDRPSGDEHDGAESCPVCDTPRVAFFRWCQSCGRDFEAFKATAIPRHAVVW